MSVIAAAISILGPILIKAGAPLLKRVLEKEVGGFAGEAGSIVVDSIAERLGVPATPEAIAAEHATAPDVVEAAIRDIETGRDWVQYLQLATAGRDRMIAREDAKSFFHSGWRPAMSWLVIFLFGWAMVLVPTVNAAFNAEIVPPSTEDILQFAGIWLVIYGGGHTAKSLWGKK